MKRGGLILQRSRAHTGRKFVGAAAVLEMSFANGSPLPQYVSVHPSLLAT